MSISSGFNIFKLGHLEQRSGWSLPRLIEVVLAYEIKSHGGGARVSSGEAHVQGSLLVLDELVLVPNLLHGFLPVVVGDDVANGGAWPVWLPIRMHFLRQIELFGLNLIA